MKVAFSLGGTGGHIFPALALAQFKREVDHLFITTESELRRALISELPVEVKVVKGGRFSLRTPKEGVSNLIGILQAGKLFREMGVKAVIATGSYSCVAPALGGVLSRIPLFLVEQNSLPGKAIRFLAPLSRKIFLAFHESVKYFPKSMREKLIVAGNPVRDQFWEIRSSYSASSGTLLFLSGSQGAKFINQLALELIKSPKAKGIKGIKVITGKRYYQAFLNELEEIKGDLKIEVYPFHRSPWELLRDSALVISRAGASTVWELGVSGRPSILIPFPEAKDNHQEVNANFMVKTGGAILKKESEASFEELIDMIVNLILDAQELERMRANLLNHFQIDPREIIWKEIELELEKIS